MLTHRLLAHVEHGFGLRTTPEPRGLVRPRQVHGARAIDVQRCRAQPTPEADAIVSREPGVPVGVLTADCVPILLCAANGALVAAVHAGWRGLARGVIDAAFDAMRHEAGGAPQAAVIGPHIGPCCYEVDAPVLEALRGRFGTALSRAQRPSRPGHVHLDLGALARHALLEAGLPAQACAALPDACTQCDATRFHSHRRDGRLAGRLVHFIAARGAPRGEA